MKSLTKYMLIILVMFSSCQDMLKEMPYGVYSTDNFFQSESDALVSLLYAYEPMRTIEYGARLHFNLTDMPTNQMRSYNKRIETQMYNWDVTPTIEEVLLVFKSAYMSISRANSVLENVGKMEGITEASRQKFLGEAYFLRAFNYFVLVRLYGEVPLHAKVVESISQSQAGYASIEAIYQFIIADLEKAVSMLEIAKQQGRADKVAAQALLAKVYLTLGSSKTTGSPGYEWVSNGEQMYAKAAEYAYSVLTEQNTYGLDPDLGRVYDVDHQSDGIEHIFITSMYRGADGMEGNWSQLPQMFLPALNYVYVTSSLYGGSQVQNCLTPSHGCWEAYRVDNEFYHTFDDQDLRKQLMVTTIYNEDGTVLATWHESNLTSTNATLAAFYYPFCRKYTDRHATDVRTSCNLYLIRFAEVALTYAEAAGPTAEGYEWVNRVRRRADLDELPAGLSVENFRKAVWKERTFELCFEGHGLYYLRRTNRVMQDITNKPVKQEYAYFYPIPQRELDLNPKK